MFDLIWHVFFSDKVRENHCSKIQWWTIVIDEREREYLLPIIGAMPILEKNIYLVPSWLWFRIMMILDYRISPF